MEFLPSSKISYVDGFSRLIPKHTEALEDTGISSLRTEVEIKMSLCNSVREFPVTLGKIKEKAFDDDFIKEIKNKIKDKDRQISDANSICNDIVMHSDRVVIPAVFQKRILKEFHVGYPIISRKSLMRSYVYWTNMDRDIKNTVKAFGGKGTSHKTQTRAQNRPTVVLDPHRFCWSAWWFLLPDCCRQLFKMAGNF